MSQAFASDESENWRKAADEEYAALMKNQTWNLTKLPPGRQAITNKWLFKRKYAPDGSVSRYKARLVVRGFSQRYGQDYDETFAPVAKFPTLQILLALAAHSNLLLQQMDVKSAYLNGEITEDIFMLQPEGYIKKGAEDLVCKLNKGLYGLKQGGRQWNQKLDKTLRKLGFRKSDSDPSLYIINKQGTYLMLLVYVDDLLIASNSVQLMQLVKTQLSNKFDMTDLGEPSYLLGVQILRNKTNGTITLNQGKYIDDVLKRFGMSEAHGATTPLSAGIKLMKAPSVDNLPPEEKAVVQAIPYKQAVGSLIYLTCLTRPDLAFPVHLVSQFLSAYNQEHWNQVKKILRYVKATRAYSVVYSRSQKPAVLVGYTDSDWAVDPISRKSVGAYLFMLAGGPVSWTCKKNQNICLSSTEAEYKAATSAAKEAVWDRRCLADMGQKQKQPTTLYRDNMGAIALSGNPVFHSRTKHVAVHHHYIRDVIAEGEIDLKYIQTTDNLADVLTKSLPSEALLKHCRVMNLMAATAPPP